nr:PREDICTED: SH3 domain-binding glutamic acid-rich protein homolog [Bemisia tabaci]
MVIKVYISGISGNKEVKKRQQRVVMILESKNIEYEAIDIAEPGKEAEKEFMQQNSKAKDSKYALPPQIFNEEEYCGDYEEFDLANELDELEKFLKVPAGSIQANDTSKSSFTNGNVTSSREQSTEKDTVERHTISSLSEDRISAENHEETEEDDETTERKSPVNHSESKDTADVEAEEEEMATDKEKSTAEETTNHTADNSDESEEEEEEEDE